MAQLSKIYKVTKTQYNTLKSGGTVGTYSWDDNALYIIEDNTQYVPTTTTINGNQLTNNIVLTGDNIDISTTDGTSIKSALDSKADISTANTFSEAQTFSKNISVTTINNWQLSVAATNSTIAVRDPNGIIRASEDSSHGSTSVVVNSQLTETTVFSTLTKCNPEYNTDVGTSLVTDISISGGVSDYKKLRFYFRGNTLSYFSFGAAVIEVPVYKATYSTNFKIIFNGSATTDYYTITVMSNGQVNTSIPQAVRINVTKTQSLSNAPNGVSEVYLEKVTGLKY